MTGAPPPVDLPPARFVTFEGGEGAGKSTQVRLLADRLRNAGIGVVTTREPGGSPGAEAIRAMILSGAAERFGAEVEAMLFAAARADHVDATIRPALARGDWVLCDRFADSTRVYQSAVEPAVIDALETVALDGLRPHLTILLDLPAEVGLQRAAARRGVDAADRFEKEDAAAHEARRDAFLRLARADPSRFAVVDATQDTATVADAVWYAIATRLGQGAGRAG
ncbi:dTMP kinase [Prosthecomicrobium sp. N25]|uniref:dTMP kinase n=1 Tax=Prosthecomicrobium sp. N25 TaxID=3129254 RepID=UPI0030784D23